MWKCGFSSHIFSAQSNSQKKKKKKRGLLLYLHVTKGGLSLLWGVCVTLRSHCRRHFQSSHCPCATAALWHTQMKDLAQDFKKSLPDIMVGFRLVPNPFHEQRSPLIPKTISPWFGFADFKANVFSNWNLFGSWCVESYKRFICAGLEEKALQVVDCSPSPPKYPFYCPAILKLQQLQTVIKLLRKSEESHCLSFNDASFFFLWHSSL